jgi:hypothetical protein
MGGGMHNAKRLVVAASITMMALAGTASANTGVAYVHGTSNNDGTFSCSGTPGTSSYKCVVSNAVSGYWGQDEIDATRGGRAYVVAGCRLGSRMPWYNASPISDDDSSVAGESGTADCVGSQLATFVRNSGVTDLVIITHSGGSNVVRYGLEKYSSSSDWTVIKNVTRKVIAVAAPSRGTYLANWVFTSGSLANFINSVLTFFGGSGYFNDDGTKFIQTGQMYASNNDSSKFNRCDTSTCNNMATAVQGITFREEGGVYPDAGIFDSKSWCGGYPTSVGLNLLHRLYLNTNDWSTYRNSCSDGFISCGSSQAMGGNFKNSHYNNHNQTRRKCGGADSAIASEVNGAIGYDDTPDTTESADVSPSVWDACGFSTTGIVTQSVYNRQSYYTDGCPSSYLGDGWCDWDCIAAYGRDAVPSWDATGTKILSWGADDCDFNSGGALAAKNPFMTDFNGDLNGNGTTDITEASNTYAQSADTSYCPDSWLNDGYCDECWLAKAGADGTDCEAGSITACYGLGDDWLGNNSFNVTNTNNATQNYAAFTVNLNAGQTITVSTSNASACSVPGSASTR